MQKSKLIFVIQNNVNQIEIEELRILKSAFLLYHVFSIHIYCRHTASIELSYWKEKYSSKINFACQESSFRTVTKNIPLVPTGYCARFKNST